MTRFAEPAKEKTGGKINIRTFPAGQLGGNLPNGQRRVTT